VFDATMRCCSFSERSAVLQVAGGKTAHTEAHRNLQAVQRFDWLCFSMYSMSFEQTRR
jgi:hypothetical protein